jgi:hypothetical protein
MSLYKIKITRAFVLLFVLHAVAAKAQTDNDAIMMNKYQWCSGATYMHSQWTNYWEGTLKRNNLNLGTVSTQSVMVMSNFGITDKLNIMAGLPYVWTHATAGTLHGMKGLQDIGLFVKWEPITVKLGSGKFSVFAIGGLSTPTTNYEPDYLPFSIGLHSTNLTWRLMLYYKTGIFFARASGSYVWRSNITIDQSSYYTTELHNTNKVQMPDLFTFNGSVGIYKKYVIAELMLDNMTTLGGFDIRRNDMPFPSNRMNSTSVGPHIKYTLPFNTHLAVVGGADFVIGGIKVFGDHILTGRNVGQATTFSFGAYYAFYVNHGSKSSKN